MRQRQPRMRKTGGGAFARQEFVHFVKIICQDIHVIMAHCVAHHLLPEGSKASVFSLAIKKENERTQNNAGCGNGSRECEKPEGVPLLARNLFTSLRLFVRISMS